MKKTLDFIHVVLFLTRPIWMVILFFVGIFFIIASMINPQYFNKAIFFCSMFIFFEFMVWVYPLIERKLNENPDNC